MFPQERKRGSYILRKQDTKEPPTQEKRDRADMYPVESDQPRHEEQEKTAHENLQEGHFFNFFWNAQYHRYRKAKAHPKM